MITVMLVYDRRALLDSLAKLVANTGIAKVVATESNGTSAIETALRLRPDLILVDVSLTGLNGIDLTARLADQWQQVRILALSTQTSPIYVRKMLNAGAHGYMLIDHASGEITDAMQCLMNGGRWIGGGLAVHAVERN